jgi:hypothetical protein
MFYSGNVGEAKGSLEGMQPILPLCGVDLSYAPVVPTGRSISPGPLMEIGQLEIWPIFLKMKRQSMKLNRGAV